MDNRITVDPDALVSSILASPSSSIPDRLLSLVNGGFTDLGELFARLHALPDRPESATVAIEWLAALDLTNGAFWTKASPATITPFGASVLGWASRAVLHGDGWEPASIEPRELVEQDAHQLAGIVRLRTLPQPFLFGAMWPHLVQQELLQDPEPLAGRVLRAALALVPADLPGGRGALAAAAVELGATLAEDTAQASRVASLEEAIGLFTAAIPCFPEGSGEWARCQSNLATARALLQEMRGGIDELGRAIAELADSAGALSPHTEDHWQIQENRALVLLDRYHAQGAATDLNTAIDILSQAARSLPEGTQEWAKCCTHWANALLQRVRQSVKPVPPESAKDLDLALALYAGAIQCLPERTLAWAICQMNRGEAFLTRYEGSGALADPRDVDRALLHFNQAAHFFAEVDRDAWASCQMNGANALRVRYMARGERGDFDDLERALDLYAAAADGFLLGSPHWANCRVNWSIALRQRAKSEDRAGASAFLEDAIARCREAISAYRRSQMLASCQQALIELAHCYTLAASGLGAFHALAEAVDLLEQRASRLPSQHDQGRLAEFDDAYQFIVHVCLWLADAAPSPTLRRAWEWEAWQYAERARSRITLQTLRSVSTSEPTSSVDDRLRLLRTLVDLDQAIEAMVARAEREVAAPRLDAPADPGDQTQVAPPGSISTLLAQREHALRQLAELDPALAVLQRVATPDLKAIQASILAVADGAIVLEFVPLPDRLAIFMLDGHDLGQYAVPLGREELRAQTRAFRHDLGVAAQAERALAWLGDKLEPFFGTLAAALPQMFPDRAGPDRVPHVLLVPSGDLHFWPLHALPLRGGTRLIDHCAVSLLPAAAALPALAAQPVSPGPYHGFAPPASGLQHGAIHMHVEAVLLGGADALRHGVHAGRAATFDALRAVRGGVLSLHTHGEANLDDPARSHIELASPDLDGEVARVPAVEFLLSLDRLHCALLLLWACETHGEERRTGDNWLGLTRAFLRAGPSLVASLWTLDDVATLKLAVPFAEGLRSRLTVPQALRWAVRQAREATTEQLDAWHRAISGELPGDERAEALASAWAKAVELEDTKYKAQLGYPVTASLGLQQWAPYVTIGWPGAVPPQS